MWPTVYIVAFCEANVSKTLILFEFDSHWVIHHFKKVGRKIVKRFVRLCSMFDSNLLPHGYFPE